MGYDIGVSIIIRGYISDVFETARKQELERLLSEGWTEEKIREEMMCMFEKLWNYLLPPSEEDETPEELSYDEYLYDLSDNIRHDKLLGIVKVTLMPAPLITWSIDLNIEKCEIYRYLVLSFLSFDYNDDMIELEDANLKGSQFKAYVAYEDFGKMGGEEHDAEEFLEEALAEIKKWKQIYPDAKSTIKASFG